MSQKIVDAMRQEAAKEGVKLNLGDPKQWNWNHQLEAKVRRENKGIDDDETPSVKPSINPTETAKVNRFSSCCNRSETFFALTGKELDAEKVNDNAGKNRVNFSVVDSRPIRMPILPANPTKTVDGREVSQRLIDAVLSYDVNVRPAILKLNTGDGHDSENSAALGRVDSTFSDGNFVWAIVSPALGAESLLQKLLVPNGLYPYRSIEVDTLTMNGGERLWLEAIAILGAQKPAILNLPPAVFSNNSGKQTYRISGQQLNAYSSASANKITLSKNVTEEKIVMMPMIRTGNLDELKHRIFDDCITFGCAATMAKLSTFGFPLFDSVMQCFGYLDQLELVPVR